MAQVWAWLLSHAEVLGGFGVAVLDLVFALNAKAASNGLLHWVYLQAKKLTGKSPPPAA